MKKKNNNFEITNANEFASWKKSKATLLVSHSKIIQNTKEEAIADNQKGAYSKKYILDSIDFDLVEVLSSIIDQYDYLWEKETEVDDPN